jgi:hypothetical protein
MFFFAFRRASFFCLAKRKETKEKATPLPLISFGLSAASGRMWNSPANFIQAQTVLAAFQLPLKPKARQGD